MSAWANETGLPHDMVKIAGQEDFVYVWTLGAEGIGDEQDKLVTIAVNPKSPQYGKVVHTVSVGGRNEAHHMGFTFDRRYLWSATLDTSKIFIFDIHSDPARPRLISTIIDFVAKSGGVVGPHTIMPMKDRMIITGLSNNRDHGGRSALVEYTSNGKYGATYWMPTDDNLQGAHKTGKYADGYNYDVRAIRRLDVMFTSGMAIASYERTIISGNSAFGRWYFGKNGAALNDSAKRGFKLFKGKAGCASCHTIQENYALFSDDAFHNTGIGWEASVGGDQAAIQVQIAPGIKVPVPGSVIESVSEPSPSDLGRYEVNQDPVDRWRYKTPPLRNVALTAPYMHNGTLGSLVQVVEFYNQGGINNPLLDPFIRPLGLTHREMEDIVAFLESLTGDNLEVLVLDAFAAPIGDRH